jgi:hypothetical protein
MLAERPLLTALALSLAAHLMVLAATGRLWTAMPEEIGFPIEASLAPMPEPETIAAAPRTRTAPAPSARPAPAEPPRPEPVVPPEPVPHPPPAALPEPAPAVPETAPAAEPAPPPSRVAEAPSSAPVASPEPVRPALPALRILPERLEIRYAVQYGEGGFTAGEARYLWQSRNGRYSLMSTVEATGLASLFVSDRIVQVSEGEVNEGGLQPEQYRERQGDRRQASARFDWTQNQLELSGSRGNVALIPQAQDLLSFPFQLAVTAREGQTEFSMAVSNGRKLQNYRFRVIGEERLNLRGRGVETLHLQGGRESTGALDVWLDRSAMHLPVQVRTLDGKGKQVTLIAEDVAIK